MHNKISKYLKILQLLLGILIISWFLWLRLLRNILPKEWPQLLDLPLEYTGSMILSFGLLWVASWNEIFHFWKPHLSSNPGLRKLTELSKWIWESPAVLFAQIWDPWKGPSKAWIEEKLLSFMHFLRHRAEALEIMLALALILNILPKLLVSVVFVVEIVILGQLKFFYSLLIILLIPLMSQCGFHILKKLAQHRLELLEKHLKVLVLPEKDTYMLEPLSANLTQELFDDYFEQWFTCHDFLAYAHDLQEFRNYQSSLGLVFHWYHYLLGWMTLFCCQISLFLQ